MKKLFWVSISLIALAGTAILGNSLWNFKIDSRIEKIVGQVNLGNITGPRPTPSQGSDAAYANVTTTNLVVTGQGAFGSLLETIKVTNSGQTATTTISSTKIGINSSTPGASFAMNGISSANPVLISSTTGAQMFAIKTNGQTIVGPNTLLNSAQMVVEHPTTNNVALNFTNGSDYTAQMGRVSAGLMYIGGPNGTSLTLQSFGTNRLFIVGTNGLIGINSSSPSADLTIVNRTASNTSTLSIGQTGVGKICLWNGASWTIESYAANSITPTIVTSTSCS